MTLPLNFIFTDPQLADLDTALQRCIKLDFNVLHIGKIITFYPSNQTADVSISYAQAYSQLTKNGVEEVTSEPYPTLYSCPVVFLGGGGAVLTFPVSPNDECLILFNDRDIDNWFKGSYTSVPNTARLHSMADAIVIVGCRNLDCSIKNFDMVRAVLTKGISGTGARVGVGAGGNTLVLIGNNTYTLGGLLQDLSTQLENLTTELQTLITNIALITVTTATVVSGVPNNALAITASATNIGSIQTSITNIATHMGNLLE
jgi:hypothetical protein